MADKFEKLLKQGPVVINIGLKDFAATLRIQGVEVVELTWAPPAGGDPELMELLEEIL